MLVRPNDGTDRHLLDPGGCLVGEARRHSRKPTETRAASYGNGRFPFSIQPIGV